MNKKMFVIAAVAAVTASSIAFAESFHREAQDQIAAKVDGNANCAQEFLFRNFVTYQGMLLTQTDYEPQRDAVIIAVNVSHMWTLTPAQQKSVQKNVLELDRYRPGSGPWDAVRKAPSKVKALLTVTPAQEAKIEAIENESGGDFLKIAQSNVSVQEKFKKHWANDEAAAKKVRAVLTPDQLKEFDAIRAAGIKLMNEAMTSNKP